MSVGVAFVTVRCSGCNEPRELSLRQSLRAGMCRQCLYPTQVEAPDDDDRRYWLEHFSDDELALLISSITGQHLSEDLIAGERRRLLGANAPRSGRRGEMARPARRTSSGVSLQAGQKVA